jgi:hypothetical protein
LKAKEKRANVVGSKEKGRRAFRVKENVTSVLGAKTGVMGKGGRKKHGEIGEKNSAWIGKEEEKPC